MPTGITRQLARFCETLKYEDLSEEAILSCKRCFIDFIGVAARGMESGAVEAILDFTNLTSPGNRFALIGAAKRIGNVQYAALANGAAAHSLELDDVHEEASIHPGVAIYPAALAVGQLQNITGRTFLLAVTVGYEVSVRLGLGLRPKSCYERGFHPTAVCGVFGAAMTASKILGNTGDGFVNALGIAGSMASGLHEYQADGSWTKRLHAGLASQNGILSAFLASKEFVGPSTIIEGREGFLRGFSNNPAPEEVLKNLGSSFALTDVAHKSHACCRYMHAPIDGLLGIVGENNLSPEDIKEVQLGILDIAFPIIVEPILIKRNPGNAVSAQFSMFYGAAISIIKRRASLSEFSEANVHSPEVANLMAKIQCVRAQALDAKFPRAWPASVRVKTFDGRVYERFIENPRGSRSNPLSWEELVQKFRYLTDEIYHPRQQDNIVDAVQGLDSSRELTHLCDLLSKQR